MHAVQKEDEILPEDRPFLAHAEHFAQSVAGALFDFFGVEVSPDVGIEIMRGFATHNRLQISIPFTGTVQGEYILALDELVAGQIVGIYDNDADDATIFAGRGDVGAALSELMNTVVGQCIGEVAAIYPYLTFFSPRLTIGERFYPPLQIFRSKILCGHGELECHFYVDHMRLDIADTLEKTLARVRIAGAAESARRVFDPGSTALLLINPDASIHRGSWAAARRVLGVEVGEENANLGHLLASISGDPNLKPRVDAWFQLAFSTQAVSDWKARVLPLRPCDELVLRDGRRVRLGWSSGRREGAAVKQVIVTIEVQSKRAAPGKRESSVFAENGRLDATFSGKDLILGLSCDHRRVIARRIEHLTKEVMQSPQDVEMVVRELESLAQSARYPWSHRIESARQVRVNEFFNEFRERVLGVPQHLVEQAFVPLALGLLDIDPADAFDAIEAMACALGNVTGHPVVLQWSVVRSVPNDLYVAWLQTACEFVRGACTALADESDDGIMASGRSCESDREAHELEIGLRSLAENEDSVGPWEISFFLKTRGVSALSQYTVERLQMECENLASNGVTKDGVGQAMGVPVTQWQWKSLLIPRESGGL
jgi:hypothetical protein